MPFKVRASEPKSSKNCFSFPIREGHTKSMVLEGHMITILNITMNTMVEISTTEMKMSFIEMRIGSR